MRIAFFHGLESPSVSDKTEYLQQNFDYVYCPEMNYRDVDIFNKTLEYVKNNNIDLLVGSSMGGFMAYCISTNTGIPTVLFNPALHSRSIDVKHTLGDKPSHHTVVMGQFDTTVPPEITKQYIKEHGIGEFDIHMELSEHRTPIEIFSKYLNKYID